LEKISKFLSPWSVIFIDRQKTCKDAPLYPLLDRLLATRPNLMMHESSEKRRFCQETWQSRALYPLGRLLATRLTGELLLTGQLAA
jgi:hypothetical protein